MKYGPTVECLGYSLFSGNLDMLPNGRKLTVNTINQYSYCIAQKDKAFDNALKNSAVLLPDGIGMVAASRILNRQKIKKIAGADLHEYLLQKLEREKGSCFYMGSSQKTLDLIKNRMAEEFPNIRVGVYSPPFKASFSKEENTAIIESVNAFQPDVLFVGMTAPKQEKWSYSNKTALQVGVICSIGAVFDFYAGTTKRPNKIWIHLGLEWFGRLLKEPRRMWKRYVYYGVVFVGYLLKEKISKFRKK